MHLLTVLVNDQGDVVGTSTSDTEGQGTGLPGQASLVARPGQHVIQVEVGDEILNLDAPALHEFIKANFLHRGAGRATSREESMPVNEHPNGPAEEVSAPSKESDLVIAPGGPRPRDSVHAVGPGEIVRVDPDGTYTIAPRNPDEDEKEDRPGLGNKRGRGKRTS
jgi:hypothetical protein